MFSQLAIEIEFILIESLNETSRTKKQPNLKIWKMGTGQDDVGKILDLNRSAVINNIAISFFFFRNESFKPMQVIDSRDVP